MGQGARSLLVGPVHQLLEQSHHLAEVFIRRVGAHALAVPLAHPRDRSGVPLGRRGGGNSGRQGWRAVPGQLEARRSATPNPIAARIVRGSALGSNTAGPAPKPAAARTAWGPALGSNLAAFQSRPLIGATSPPGAAAPWPGAGNAAGPLSRGTARMGAGTFAAVAALREAR